MLPSMRPLCVIIVTRYIRAPHAEIMVVEAVVSSSCPWALVAVEVVEAEALAAEVSAEALAAVASVAAVAAQAGNEMFIGI